MAFKFVRRLAVIFGTLLLTCSAQSASAGALSGPIAVNPTGPGAQNLKSITAGANGEKLLLWTDSSQNYASWVQRMDSAGNLFPTKYPVKPRSDYAVADRVGNFAVVSQGPDGQGDGVAVTLYDRNGNTRVNSFRISSTTASGIIAMDANGNLAALYTDYISQKWTLSLKRYNANGAQVGAEIAVASPTSATQAPSGIAIDGSSNITVTWINGVPNSTNSLDVYMRRYNNAGTALGAAAMVNTYTQGWQDGGSIGMTARGDLVITYNSLGQDGNGFSMYAQRYNASGSAVGSPIRVSPSLYEINPGAMVSVMDDGSFVVVWDVDNRNSNPSFVPMIYARQFRADGTPVGNEFQVNPAASDKAFFQRVAMDRAGNFLVGWSSYNSSNGYDAFVRPYVMDSNPTVSQLNNNQTVIGLSGATSSWTYFKISVPVGAKQMNVTLSSNANIGDADLYIRFGALPTLTAWDARPYLTGSNESVAIVNPPVGDWYIGVQGYSAYSSVSLNATYW